MKFIPLVLIALPVLAWQINPPLDCSQQYEHEGSRLYFCDLKAMQFPNKETGSFAPVVSGYLYNASWHYWARATFRVTLTGLDSNGKSVEFSQTLSYDEILRDHKFSFSHIFEASPPVKNELSQLGLKIEPLEDYMFPRKGQLEEAIQAARKEEDEAQRISILKSCKPLLPSAPSIVSVCGLTHRKAFNRSTQREELVLSWYILNTGSDNFHKAYFKAQLRQKQGKRTELRLEEDYSIEALPPQELRAFSQSFFLADLDSVNLNGLSLEIISKPEWMFVSKESERVSLEATARKQAQIDASQRALMRQNTAALAKRCNAVYDSTSNKRIVQLTVAESQAIDACRALGLYRPSPPNTSRPALKVQ